MRATAVEIHVIETSSPSHREPKQRSPRANRSLLRRRSRREPSDLVCPADREKPELERHSCLQHGTVYRERQLEPLHTAVPV